MVLAPTCRWGSCLSAVPSPATALRSARRYTSRCRPCLPPKSSAPNRQPRRNGSIRARSRWRCRVSVPVARRARSTGSQYAARAGSVCAVIGLLNMRPIPMRSSHLRADPCPRARLAPHSREATAHRGNRRRAGWRPPGTPRQAAQWVLENWRLPVTRLTTQLDLRLK